MCTIQSRHDTLSEDLQKFVCLSSAITKTTALILKIVSLMDCTTLSWTPILF